MPLVNSRYLRVAGLTLSALLVYWSAISVVSDVPPPSFALRALAASVGTILLFVVRAPLGIHVFWGVVHALPLVIVGEQKNEQSNPRVDAAVVCAYAALLACCSGENNPYLQLLAISSARLGS